MNAYTKLKETSGLADDQLESQNNRSEKRGQYIAEGRFIQPFCRRVNIRLYLRRRRTIQTEKKRPHQSHLHLVRSHNFSIRESLRTKTLTRLTMSTDACDDYPSHH